MKNITVTMLIKALETTCKITSIRIRSLKNCVRLKLKRDRVNFPVAPIIQSIYQKLLTQVLGVFFFACVQNLKIFSG